MWSALADRIRRSVIRMHKRRGTVLISDTTLRDGEQMPGVRLGPDQKVTIAKALAEAGIHSIDAGFPAASDEEVRAIQRIVMEVRGPVITAHCRTLKADIDKAAEALQEARSHKKAVQVFIGISPIHRQHKHGKSKAEVIKMATEAIAYARQHFYIISFGPEDASRTEPEYLHQVYREAIDAGASNIGFADTVGILTPEKAADAIKGIQDNVPNIGDALLGVHFHNDLGLATANALAAVSAGANIVQGTINGIGERAGNTPIEEVVMALYLHPDQYASRCGVDPRSLTGLSHLVADLTGVAPAPNKAVVGTNMFATESGVHQDGLLKDPRTYLPFLPEEVGAGPVQLRLGKHSGRKAVRYQLQQRGIELTEEQIELVVQRLKEGTAGTDPVGNVDLHQLLREIFGAAEPASPQQV